MTNIILDEKRFLRIGESCAVNLKNIHPIDLMMNHRDNNNVTFYASYAEPVSIENEYTLVKYLGNGMFMDLIADQLYLTEVYLADDFGTDEFDVMLPANQEHLKTLADDYNKLSSPDTLEEFRESLVIFSHNPLVIDISETPFFSVDLSITKKVASQSIETIKSKILSSKINAQQRMQQKYGQLETEILNLYSREKDSAPKGY